MSEPVEEMKDGKTFLQFPTLVSSRSGSTGIFSGRQATPAKNNTPAYLGESNNKVKTFVL